MSFRQANQHARWTRFRDAHRKRFEPLVRADLAAVTEADFAEYLKNGSQPKFRAALREINDDDFLSLEEIVNRWFDFQDQYESFDAERLRRFKRYG